MSKLSKLLQVTEDEKSAMLKHYGIIEEQFDENVNILKEWISKSGHLPKEFEENKLRVALLNSKMSIEKAKQTIEGYFRLKAKYSNELFDRIVPNTEDYIDSKKFVTTVIMPKLTPDLCRVTIFKMRDPNGEASDPFLYVVMALMMGEIRIANDLFLSNIVVFDFEDYGWKNLIKFTPAVNQKLVDILMTIHVRIQSIHFVNLNSIMDQLMRLLKIWLPTKILGKVTSHRTYESLLEQVPRECLPSNYGGTEKSLEELYDEWCEQIEESEELFQKLLSLKSTEKIELDPSQQSIFGCGAEGSFKQLCLD